jgi:hypothetical protein
VKRLTLIRARRRRLLGLALCTLVAVVAAAINASGTSPIAAASIQAVVDVPRASVVHQGTDSPHLQSITARTLLLGELMSSPPVLTRIAQRAGVDRNSLSATTSYVQNIPEQMLGPDLEVRGMQIIKMRAPYQLDIEPDPNIPRLRIYARAPSVPAAAQLADAAVKGLGDYLHATEVARNVGPSRQISVTEIGAAVGTMVNSHTKYEIAGLTFLIVFGLCAALLLCGTRIRSGWKLASRRRRAAASELSEADATDPGHSLLGAPRSGVGPLPRRPVDIPRRGGFRSRRPVPVPGSSLPGGDSGIGGPRLGARRRQADVGHADDWPHTTRILPWMIAAFMAVLWLVPFDSVQLSGSSLPIDLKFDRIVLPIMFLLWVLALAAGGRAAPRLRLTWAHAGVLGFAALTCLTFVVNAHYLDQTFQITRAIKQLLLLGAYVIFFLMTASIVRRSEVLKLLRYTLVLAVLTAIGTIIEYRFHYNIFYDLAHRLLPGFNVGVPSSGADNLGRRVVEGPGGAPLEAVGMFTLALPIALVGITDAIRWRQRVLYGLAAAILVAGAVATERKSGLLGPLAVVLAVAFFRRRQMLRFVPLALVLLVVVKLAAPGATSTVTSQLAPSQLGVSTVSERVVRYDAIRPDVWLHLAIGQGFGVYSVRVLDNEFLDRLIEGGVLGLATYVLMLLSIVFVAVGPVRRREPVAGTAGLVAAAAAIGTLVLSGTYDSIGFPHVPYILFSLVALLAVAVEAQPPGVAQRVWPIGVGRSGAPQPRTGRSHRALEEIWSS